MQLMDVMLREISADAAMLTLEVQNSRIVSIDENLPPTTSRDDMKSVLPVRSGGIYLVGAFEADSIEKGRSIGFRQHLRSRSSSELYQVWAKAFRIKGDAAAARSPEARQGSGTKEVE